jgi:hypothetical protein
LELIAHTGATIFGESLQIEGNSFGGIQVVNNKIHSEKITSPTIQSRYANIAMF